MNTPPSQDAQVDHIGQHISRLNLRLHTLDMLLEEEAPEVLVEKQVAMVVEAHQHVTSIALGLVTRAGEYLQSCKEGTHEHPDA